MLAEGLEQVDVLDLARDLAPRRDARRDHLLDLLQAGLLADRRRAGPAELDAVVLRGVVARGEHRAGRVEAPGREVDEVGRSQADVGDVGAGERGAFDERGRERPDDGRMSWPTTRCCAPVKCANALPIRRASASSISSG